MRAVARLKPGRDRSARQRHPWIYAGAVSEITGPVTDGDVIRVVDAEGGFVAWGYLNRASQITIRLLSWEEQVYPDETWLAGRLARAINWRQQRLGYPTQGAARLVYAESDGLPGLVVDRYADWLVVQFLTLGSERWRASLLAWLCAELKPRGIYERSDVDVREKEGLTLHAGPLWGEAPPPEIEVEEDGQHFLVDIAFGHKTGFYLDQRVNRARVAAYSAGREVLNCFSYSGAFGVYAAAAGASDVWQVDTSAEALNLARRNMDRNGHPLTTDHYVEADVFQLLRAYRDRARRFDLIILDPPKFAFAQSQVERACRGYKDINRLAMQLLQPEGILVTFSCSGAISVDLFQKVLFSAALDARREVQIAEILTQAPDHPVLITFPEAAYLKGFVCRVL